MFRIKQHFGTIATKYEHQNAKIDALSLEIRNEKSTILKTTNFKQLQEITRRNCNLTSIKNENIVFLSREQLGNFRNITEKEKIQFDVQLNAFTEPKYLENVPKEFIVTNIYLRTKSINATLENVVVVNFFK
jgi:hypothetical protein